MARGNTAESGAVWICFRERDRDGSSQMTPFPDFATALEAAQVVPCGPGCLGDHSIAYRVDGRIRTTQVRRPDVDDVRRRLRAALDGNDEELERLWHDLDPNQEGTQQ